jgi:hypothetical protein
MKVKWTGVAATVLVALPVDLLASAAHVEPARHSATVNPFRDWHWG